jgi:4-aminobutyrate aminotransferase/(S)-3-amino-2-methylpropionate transaminase
VSVQDAIDSLEALFKNDVEPSRVAAIIIEPVQGEGGFHIAPPALLHALRATCDTHGILLIADEIQSGLGRTGRMFAIQHSGVEPDLVTVAKALAGGFPLSAVVGRAAIMDKVEPGGLGGTYAGSPIGCAAALAVLDVMAEEKLLMRAETIGGRIRARLAPLAARSDVVPTANLRGLGAMLAIDVVKADTGEPDGNSARLVAARALAKGLVILTCGGKGETLRMLLPLTIPDAVLEEGLDILEAALRDVKSTS